MDTHTNNNEDRLEMIEKEFDKAFNDFDTVIAKLVKETDRGDMIEDGVVEYPDELKEKVKQMSCAWAKLVHAKNTEPRTWTELKKSGPTTTTNASKNSTSNSNRASRQTNINSSMKHATSNLVGDDDDDDAKLVHKSQTIFEANCKLVCKQAQLVNVRVTTTNTSKNSTSNSNNSNRASRQTNINSSMKHATSKEAAPSTKALAAAATTTTNDDDDDDDDEDWAFLKQNKSKNSTSTKKIPSSAAVSAASSASLVAATDATTSSKRRTLTPVQSNRKSTPSVDRSSAASVIRPLPARAAARARRAWRG